MYLPKNIENICDKLIQKGHEAYIIGGAVRDWLLGMEPKDYDIFTEATGEQILEIFPNGKVIGNEDRQNKILTVVVDDVEVSQFRKNGERTEVGKSIEDHLATCDFRINSIAWDYKNEKFIDPNKGNSDLVTQRPLQTVGDPEQRIKEDKLRILRALRFSSQFNRPIEGKLGMIIKNTNLDDVPKERIRDELIKILKYEDSFKKLYEYEILYDKIKLLKFLHIPGGKYHGENVFDHTNYTYQNMIKLTDDYRLIFAAIFHDMGKFPTHKYDEEKETFTFHNHDNVGANMTKEVMESLKFSNEDIKFVTTLVRHHMHGVRSGMKRSTLKKLFRKLHEGGVDIYDLILLQYCDNQANMKNERQSFHEYLKNNWTLKKYCEITQDEFALTRSDLEINGKDLIDLGIEPGPKMGEILNDIMDQVDCGFLRNKKPALIHYVKTGMMTK